MKKISMITTIVEHPLWDGEKDKSYFMKNYTKEQIQDIYDYIQDAEYYYYDECY